MIIFKLDHLIFFLSVNIQPWAWALKISVGVNLENVRDSIGLKNDQSSVLVWTLTIVLNFLVYFIF